MGIAIAAIGVKISYAAEATAGTRPTTGYIKLPDLKSTPSFNPQPNTADASTFDNEEYTTYVELLKDMGGALAFDANHTDALYTAWSTMKTTFDALSDGKQMWFCIDIPNFSNAIFFTGTPSKMGVPEMSHNTLIETQVYITPTSEPLFAADPTYSV